MTSIALQWVQQGALWLSGRARIVKEWFACYTDYALLSRKDRAVTAILIRPDAFFSAAQYERLQSLLARRDALSPDERQELEGLIDAELDATVARTEAFPPDAGDS